MSLRLKLLLLGLATLVLPWGGCRYAREMESALREGEENSLQAVAQTIAASLQGRGDLLYREGKTHDVVQAGPYDLKPIVLSAQPFLDGYAGEWPHAPSAWAWFAKGRHRFGILTGVFERTLYLQLDVQDEHLVFDTAGANPLESGAAGDRVWLGMQDADGLERQFFIAATGPGSVTARHIETGEYGQQQAVDEPRIVGAWQPSPQGYRLELRVPLSMIGRRFGVLIDDRDARGATPVSYGTLNSDDLHTVGRLIVAAPELTGYLAQFMQPGLRLSVTTPGGLTLARADALAQVTELGPERGILARFYRRFVDRPGERKLIESAAPIYDRDHRDIIGDLQVTQTADRWLGLRDRALTQMLNFTLITSAVAVMAMFAFAARLAVRLSRLRRASESALTREGLVTTFPETAAPDELGDVARGFSTLLGRLNEYTGYLRTLAGKLAHEIRTPLTIVRSSLENLESEEVPVTARVYLERARQGSERLNAILIAMGAATRVEEAIGNSERSRFDLVPVIASAADAYRAAFPQRGFAIELPHEPVMIDGAPDLIVQMLDKLIDNAVDFSPPAATLTIRLDLEPHAAVLEVDNPGPPLAPETQARLFESLWQSRGGDSDGRPHFGLGLYIVRLIAEFHGGSASAANLPGAAGARFSVRLGR
ncbi:MAG: Histidine kinase [Gammaproteobacteria bacterium]|nr:Histidine kinase [Gammaproteobacteria bacterium]